MWLRANNPQVGYQGWSSQATWAMALWINNQREIYDKAQQLAAQIIAQQSNPVSRAIAFRDGIMEFLHGTPLGQNVLTDVNNGGGEPQINWDEVWGAVSQSFAPQSPQEVPALTEQEMSAKIDTLLDQYNQEQDPQRKTQIEQQIQRLRQAELRGWLKR